VGIVKVLLSETDFMVVLRVARRLISSLDCLWAVYKCTLYKQEGWTWPMKKGIYLTLLFVAMLLMLGWNGQAQKQQSVKVVWEYKVVLNHLDEQNLNELGRQGWELIQFDHGVRAGGSRTNESYIFKRSR
jgi:hypothetical protein